ncbi:histidinol-phosphate transaminase [Candidatus Nitrosotenuis uzonensis]|uniref:Putative aminotransferase class I and II n=1 Tax=Candidatus Nitrosotenuis uzonensis TaxID=1407055 RepID=A0A812F163_9ARCH|nr:histidinol-phosphate transaminase [Candidatus Nitrosotenuis uzonensis]CAE6487196.1 putative aminotransferase class I and II [Candidatus Nitrosotenuis uzonensis]
MSFEKRLDELSKLQGYQKPAYHQGVLKLDSNENFAVPRQFQQEIIDIAKKNADIREYPLGKSERLIAALSKYIQVPANMLSIGNGSDQILDIILCNFASKKTRILTSDPTFGFFEERCKLYQIPTIKVPFSKEMTLNVQDFVSRYKNADILYLDSPNNPTGFQFKKEEISDLIKRFSGLVIVDEAYGEFSDYTVATMTKKFENLVVVRTFSKSFGMAGLRLGYVVASKKFIDVFSRVLQYPYPINTMAIEGGIAALQKSHQISEVISLVKSERARIIKKLRETGAFDVFDSKANFVLFDARGADKRIYTALLEQGISIRKLGRIGKHEGCLRVTVGTKDMNSKFLLAMRDFLQ